MKRVLAVALVLLSSLPAFADGPDAFGEGSRAAALGSGISAKSGDWASAYYNPAGIASPRRVVTGFGVNAGHTNLSGFHDVIVGYDGFGNPVRGDVHTKYDDVAGFNAGLAIPLTPRFSVGVTLWAPMQRLVRIMTEDPYIPAYVMYVNRSQRITLNAAGAYRFGDRVRLGLGVSTLARSDFSQNFNIPAGNGSETNNSRALITLDIVPTITPIGGLQWDVSDAIALGLAYRGQTDLRVKVDQVSGADVVIPVGTTLRFRSAVAIAGGFDIVDHFTPQQLVLGTSWDKPGSRFAIMGDLTWMNWSAFKGPYIDPQFDPINVPPLGQVAVNWRRPPKTGFRDTIVPRIGAEFHATEALAIRAGYSFEMTPAPAATGEGNVLDSNSHVISGGAGYRFKDPTGWAKNPVTLNAHVRARELVPLTARKATAYNCSDTTAHPPTGYPCSGEISVSGSVVSGGADLDFEF